MLKKIKELENMLDLKKKYPGYFTKKTTWILFIVLLLILVLMAISVSIDGLGGYYAYCDDVNGQQCFNPLYDESCEFTGAPCLDKYIQHGDHIGKKPHYLTSNLPSLFFTLLLLGVLANHMIHTRE